MSWRSNFISPFFWGGEPRAPSDSLPFNEQCFIRKGHKCGKLFGASKSCFIACPTDDNLEPILELMSEKLAKVGIEPIIAVKERAYGQDIFCTKICGKIIESRFCIVILDDTLKEGNSIPNPNVYYEYGLMTSLRKHIIPLQKEDLELAFNIQSYDTIKYTSRNVAAELDRAIRDAIRITEARESDDRKVSLPEKTLLRKLELSGLEKRDDKWILHEAIADTNFMGFGQYNERFYLYLGKIDDTAEVQDHLDDLGVAVFRTEKKVADLKKQLAESTAARKRLALELKRAKKKSSSPEKIPLSSRRLPYEHEIKRLDESITDIKGKLDLMSTIYIGFILGQNIDADSILDQAKQIIGPAKRYKLSVSVDDNIKFGSVEVLLSGPAH